MLTVSECADADRIAAAFAPFESHVMVIFEDCPLTDIGLRSISRSAELNYVRIKRTMVTEQGIKRLRELHPLAQVECDFGVFSPDLDKPLVPLREVLGAP